MHADRGDLALSYPDAGEPGPPLRRDLYGGEEIDHRLFQVSHVASEVAAVPAEVDDRIEHDLSWPVVGDVSSALDVVHGDSFASQGIRRNKEVLSRASSADGEHRVVFDREDRVWDGTLDAQGMEAKLALMGRLVGLAAQRKVDGP